MKVTLLLFLGILLSQAAQSQSSYGMYPLITIGKINETPRDTVKLKVYVVEVYVCPPCPPGAQCKPCMENNITVADEKLKDISKVPAEKLLRVITREAESFKIGKRYFLTVRFRRNKETQSEDAVLVSSKAF